MARSAPVELVSSYAYRDGDDVRLVMDVPDQQVAGTSVTMRFRSGERVFRRPANAVSSSRGVRLEAAVPARRLGRQVWALAIQPDEGGPFLRLQARLLAKPDQPVALLTGPVPTTRLPEPAPRSSASSRVRHLAGRARATVVGSRDVVRRRLGR
jgi:hypothetical protein